MQRTELIRKLMKGGWKIIPGGKHSKTSHPSNIKHQIPVPNGSKINDITVKQIFKRSGTVIVVRY